MASRLSPRRIVRNKQYIILVRIAKRLSGEKYLEGLGKEITGILGKGIRGEWPGTLVRSLRRKWKGRLMTRSINRTDTRAIQKISEILHTKNVISKEWQI